MAYILNVCGKSAALVSPNNDTDWLDLTLSAEAYAVGSLPPFYPVPAIVQCDWCGSKEGEYCTFNGDGYWCPSLCFALN